MTATEDWLKSIGKTNGAKTALALSVDERKPDDLAEHARIGQQLGLPPVVVGSDPEAFKARAEQKRIADLLATSPKTAAWLSDRANGGLAKDDVENLSWYEGVFNNPLTRGVARGAQTSVGNLQAFGAMQSAIQAGDIGLTKEQMIAKEIAAIGLPADQIPNDYLYAAQLAGMIKYDAISGMGDDEKSAMLKRAADQMKGARETIASASKIPRSEAGQAFASGEFAASDGSLGGALGAIAKNPLGALAFLGDTVAESLPAIAIGSVATIATRSPAVGALAMGGTSFATTSSAEAMSFLEQRGVKLDTPEDVAALLSNQALLQEARQYGLDKGVIIGALDALSGGVAGKAMVKSRIGDMLLQSIAQATMGAGGELLAQAAADGKLDWNQIIVEGLAEFVTAPAEVVGVAGRGLIRQFSRNAKTGATAQTLADADAKVQESKLRVRDPAKFEDAMANATPGQFIYVPSDDLNTFFQAKDANFDPEAWGINATDFAEQSAAGGNIAIPMATYLAKISGTPDAAWFHENSSFSDDEMSIAEAKKFNSEVRDVIERSLQEADRARIADLESRASDVQVKDNLYSQLRAAGNTADAAEKMAAAQTAFIRTMASRVGEDSLDLSRRFGLVIEGPEANDFRRRGDLDIALNTIRSGRMPKPKGASLSEFIAAKGGVRDTGGDFEAMGAPKELIAQTRAESQERAASPSMLGMSEVGKGDTLDNLARAAVEAGYFPDLMGEVMGNDGPEADLAAVVMEALREELAGRKTYVPGEGVDPALQNLADEISRLGMDISASNDEIAAALQGEGLSQDPFAVEGWQDAEVSVQADDGKAVKMKAGEVEAIIQERLSAARALLECMNG